MKFCLATIWVFVTLMSGCHDEAIITTTVDEEAIVVQAHYIAPYTTIRVSPQVWGFGNAGYGAEGIGMSVGGLVLTRKFVANQYQSIFQSSKHGELVSPCSKIYQAVKARKWGEKIVLRLREKYSLSCPDERCEGGKKLKLLEVSVVAVL